MVKSTGLGPDFTKYQLQLLLAAGIWATKAT